MKKVFLSEESKEPLKEYLRNKGFDIIEIKNTGRVYEAISSHPDIYVCKIKEDIVIEENQYNLIKDQLKNEEEKYHIGKSGLWEKYPGTIKYNAVALGPYFIHHIKNTDEKVLEIAMKNDMLMVDVKQGYTKCNCVLVDDHSIITSDVGIAKTLRDKGIDVLLISKGQVKLSGFEYGFLGGASGKIGNEIVFNGNLKEHKDFLPIKEFIEERQVKIKYFEEYPLEDIGSIIEV